MYSRLDDFDVDRNAAPHAFGDDAEVFEQALASFEPRPIGLEHFRRQLDIDAADPEAAVLVACNVRDDSGRQVYRLDPALRRQNAKLAARQLPIAAASTAAALGPEPSPSGAGSSKTIGGRPSESRNVATNS